MRGLRRLNRKKRRCRRGPRRNPSRGSGGPFSSRSRYPPTATALVRATLLRTCVPISSKAQDFDLKSVGKGSRKTLLSERRESVLAPISSRGRLRAVRLRTGLTGPPQRYRGSPSLLRRQHYGNRDGRAASLRRPVRVPGVREPPNPVLARISVARSSLLDRLVSLLFRFVFLFVYPRRYTNTRRIILLLTV